MIITKINSIVEVHGKDVSDPYQPIYVVKNEQGLLGIEDSNGATLLKNEYDSIAPLGSGMWMISKKDKWGLVVLGDDDLIIARENHFLYQIDQFHRELHMSDQNLCIMDLIPCQYDFIECHGKAVMLRNHDKHALDDLYIRNNGMIIHNVYDCEHIHVGPSCSSYYFISRRSARSGETEQILYNAINNKKVVIEKGYYPASDGVTDSNRAFYLTCCSSSDASVIIYKLQGNKVIKSPVFDGIPTQIRPFSGEFDDEPLFFIGKRNGKTIFIDKDFFEIKAFKRLKVIISLIHALLNYSK